jgi:hypothetical protein
MRPVSENPNVPTLITPVVALAALNPVGATEVGVTAPSTKVIAGVVVAVATVPETPFAVVTLTLVTVPELLDPPVCAFAVLSVGLIATVGDVPPESVAVTFKYA